MKANNQQIKFLKQVINKHIDPKDHVVFLFGSRVDGSASKYSDFDIGISGSSLKGSTFFDIKEEFDESDFPYIVDLVDFNMVSDDFKQIAMANKIQLN